MISRRVLDVLIGVVTVALVATLAVYRSSERSLTPSRAAKVKTRPIKAKNQQVSVGAKAPAATKVAQAQPVAVAAQSVTDPAQPVAAPAQTSTDARIGLRARGLQQTGTRVALQFSLENLTRDEQAGVISGSARFIDAAGQTAEVKSSDTPTFKMTKITHKSLEFTLPDESLTLTEVRVFVLDTAGNPLLETSLAREVTSMTTSPASRPL